MAHRGLMAIRLAHRLGIAQVELHAAHVGLVRDGLRVQLQHDRIAHGFGLLHCLIFAACHPRLHGRDAVGRQQRLGFDLGQQGAARRRRRRRSGCAPWRTIDPPGVVASPGQRRFVQPAQVVGVAPHVGEHARRRVGIGERRDIGLVQKRLSRLHGLAAHPAGQYRFAEYVSVRFELFGGPGRVGHGLRRQDHQQAVAVRVLRRDFDGLAHSAPGRRRPECRSDCCGSSAAGSSSFRACTVSADSSASSPPAARSARRSPARPGPPALVTIVRRGPFGRGCLASTSAM